MFAIIFQCVYYGRRLKPIQSQTQTTISMSPIIQSHPAPLNLEGEVMSDPCNIGETPEIITNPMHKNVAI